MEHTNKFKFLKVDVIEKKDKSGIFLKLHCLDEDSNVLKFFVAKDELIKKISDLKLITLQDVTVNYTVTQNNDTWNVRVNDIIPVPANNK